MQRRGVIANPLKLSGKIKKGFSTGGHLFDAFLPGHGVQVANQFVAPLLPVQKPKTFRYSFDILNFRELLLVAR